MSVFDWIKPLKGHWKPLLAGGLVFTVVLVIFVPAPPQAATSWVAVSSQSLEHEIGLVGKIEPLATALITAPFDAIALANTLSLGMPVEEGQALLSLDTQLLEIKVREALANKLKMQQSVAVYRAWATGSEVRQARQALRVAELAMQRLDLELSQVETLYQKGIVPRNERDTLKQQHTQQALELIAAKAQLKDILAAGEGEGRSIANMDYQNASIVHEQLNALLQQKTLHAPFSGVVLALGSPQLTGGEVAGLYQGTLLSKGQQLIKLGNMQGLKIVTQVSEADVNKLALNQPVAISGEGFAGQQLSGYVSAISQLAVQDDSIGNAARFPITITVNASGSEDFTDIRLGMSVHMIIVTYRNENSFIVPHTAIKQVGDASFVEYRESPDAPVVTREVRVGQSTVEGVEVFGLDSGFVSVKVPAQ